MLPGRRVYREWPACWVPLLIDLRFHNAAYCCLWAAGQPALAVFEGFSRAAWYLLSSFPRRNPGIIENDLRRSAMTKKRGSSKATRNLRRAIAGPWEQEKIAWAKAIMFTVILEFPHVSGRSLSTEFNFFLDLIFHSNLANRWSSVQTGMWVVIGAPAFRQINTPA